MGKIVDRLLSLALALGAPGLFLVTFLDSSFLSFPEATDLLLIWMVTAHKTRMVLYSGAAVLGSVAGCLALYYVGRKGGEAVVRSRFSSGRVDRALEVVRKYGLMAVLIPSVLPPPAPFKIFVLLAGVAEIPASRFAMAIAVGRGARYFGEGLLAVRYGDSALQFLQTSRRTISLGLAALLVAALAGFVVWRKAQSRTGR